MAILLDVLLTSTHLKGLFRVILLKNSKPGGFLKASYCRRKRGESQALGIIFGSKACFNFWINIEIEVKYRIENQLHRDWWLDTNLMVKKCLGTKNGPKPMGLPPFLSSSRGGKIEGKVVHFFLLIKKTKEMVWVFSFFYSNSQD
jgi:hypothetical protein